MTRGAETSSADPTGTGSTLEGPAPYPPFVKALDALVALAPPRPRARSAVLHPPRRMAGPPHPHPHGAARGQAPPAPRGVPGGPPQGRALQLPGEGRAALRARRGGPDR